MLDAAQHQQSEGANQSRRGRNVIMRPLILGGDQMQGAGKLVPSTQPNAQAKSTPFRFVLPSDVSNPETFKKYALAVQREAEVH